MSYNGIPYFSHECITPMHIRLIQSKFGIAGYAVVYKLYEKIFSNGYYIDWNEEYCDIFAFEDCRLKAELVQNIVDLCIKKGVFDANLFEKHGVLTSVEIQEKFYNAAKHRRNFSFDPELCLIEVVRTENGENNKAKKPDLFAIYKAAVESKSCKDIIVQVEIIKPWLEIFDVDVIIHAFDVCVRKGKENEDYLWGILGNWKKQGIKKLCDIDDPVVSDSGGGRDLPGNIKKSKFRNYPQDGCVSDIEKEMINKMLARAGKS